MILFFIVLGLNVGVFVGSFLLGKKVLISCGIPCFKYYAKEGGAGKVISGFSGYGADLYVPASRLEEATAMGRRCSSSQASRASSPGFLGTGFWNSSSATRCRLSMMALASQSSP